MQNMHHTHLRGFSLVELTIVMGVIGTLLGGIWMYAASARQTQNLTITLQSISLTADAVRASYSAAASISGGIATVMNTMIQTGGIPTNLLRSTASTCVIGGVSTTANFADSPLNNSIVNSCGTFRVCAWNYGTDTACGTSLTTQYFAIELITLNYAGCVQTTTGISASTPPGLIDVYINGAEVGPTVPVAPSTAAANCAGATLTNKVDFIYTLRTPPVS
jgi:prepilin-type N-terminal cleavage/methylation domain-containing protein